jgi:LPPG:FO 2-phospho-L-lactate transferase
MIAFLSGGTGTPKLLRGVRVHREDRDLAVVVNTAEDIWISGNHLSPDVDTVIYLFAGILDTDTWWGIRGDTFATHGAIRAQGGDEFIRIGDRDRAVHVLRGEALRRGERLTDVTVSLCRRLGVAARVLPMADTPVTTLVDTGEGLLHFQDYWVRHRGKVPIREVIRSYREEPRATPEVLDELRGAEGVVIGPSNPVTSVAPILECRGIPEALAEQYVVAVSPFIGDRPVSGPAAALMQAFGREPTSAGTAALYGDLVDCFIQDIRDPVQVKGAVRCDTLMVDEKASGALAEQVLRILEKQP